MKRGVFNSVSHRKNTSKCNCTDFLVQDLCPTVFSLRCFGSVAFNVFLFVVANRSVLQVCPKPIILVEKLHPFLAVAKTFSRRENLFSRTTECALLPLRVE